MAKKLTARFPKLFRGSEDEPGAPKQDATGWEHAPSPSLELSPEANREWEEMLGWGQSAAAGDDAERFTSAPHATLPDDLASREDLEPGWNEHARAAADFVKAAAVRDDQPATSITAASDVVPTQADAAELLATTATGAANEITAPAEASVVVASEFSSPPVVAPLVEVLVMVPAPAAQPIVEAAVLDATRAPAFVAQDNVAKTPEPSEEEDEAAWEDLIWRQALAHAKSGAPADVAPSEAEFEAKPVTTVETLEGLPVTAPVFEVPPPPVSPAIAAALSSSSLPALTATPANGLAAVSANDAGDKEDDADWSAALARAKSETTGDDADPDAKATASSQSWLSVTERAKQHGGRPGTRSEITQLAARIASVQARRKPITAS